LVISAYYVPEYYVPEYYVPEYYVPEYYYPVFLCYKRATCFWRGLNIIYIISGLKGLAFYISVETLQGYFISFS
jgi:hypothetical protein